MNFEEYLDLIKDLANSKITNKDKFFNVLDLAKQNAKEVDNKVQASLKSIMLPKKYKNEVFTKVIACYCDDYSLAMEDMKDPEKYAAILSILNDKLAKDGDVYDISTPETEMLGLANRYANNARECQYARQWKLFAFYMRSLAYFIPQLIHKANLNEEKILNRIEAKLKLIAEIQPGLPQDMIMGKEITAVTIPPRVKKLLEEASMDNEIPMVYLKTLKGKGEMIISYDPKFRNYSIAKYENGRPYSSGSGYSLQDIYQRVKNYYSKSASKRWGEPHFFLEWSNPSFTDIKKLDQELDASVVTSYAKMQDKDLQDLKKWVIKQGYNSNLLSKFTKEELQNAWDLMLNRTNDQRDLEEWFMFLVA